jgi:hypothetical protein
MTNATPINAENIDIENTETFGNRLVHGIDEIMLPADISLLPTAPGWQLLGVLIGIYIIYRTIRFSRLWFKNRYRRAALNAIAELGQHNSNPIDVAGKLPFYLKATALQAYPRQQIAAMSGQQWLSFLDSQSEGVYFSGPIGVKLLSIAYQAKSDWHLTTDEAESLIRMSQTWIKHHNGQSPDSKQRVNGS